MYTRNTHAETSWPRAQPSPLHQLHLFWRADRGGFIQCSCLGQGLTSPPGWPQGAATNLSAVPKGGGDSHKNHDGATHKLANYSLPTAQTMKAGSVKTGHSTLLEIGSACSFSLFLPPFLAFKILAVDGFREAGLWLPGSAGRGPKAGSISCELKMSPISPAGLWREKVRKMGKLEA